MLNNSIKTNGVVYTPIEIVNMILKESGYINDPEKNKKTIIDPSCGDGRFLVEILKLLIIKNIGIKTIENLLYGWDIDEEAVYKCKNNLNNVLKSFEFTENISWNNIYVKNSLLSFEKYINFFDYVVGNPPYIRIQNLKKEQKNLLKNNYYFCKNGSTDIYFAFFELGIKLLNKEGILSYISPNSYMKTDSGKLFRNYLIDNKMIKSINDFNDIQIFDSVSTYTSITTLTNLKTQSFTYKRMNKDFVSVFNNIIKTSSLPKDKHWSFDANGVYTNINSNKKLLGDIASIKVGIATLSDSCYIFKSPEFCGKLAKIRTIIDDIEICSYVESEILKPIIKASTLKNENDFQDMWILFPYEKNEKGLYSIIYEEVLKNKFPNAYEYLKNIKWKLDKRDNGKKNSVAWYAFGRSQGINSSFGKKIITSPINEKPNFIKINNEETTFYSGYGIFYNGNLEKLCEKLNSKEMDTFIKITSKDYRNGWKSYAKAYIKLFPVDIK